MFETCQLWGKFKRVRTKVLTLLNLCVSAMRNSQGRSPYVFERERAEAGALLPSDKITKAKRGIAVQRE